MLGNNNTYYILSAELNTLTKYENDTHTNLLRTILLEREEIFSEVQGVYSGVNEVSFIVKVNFENADFIKDLAFNTFNQESILIVDPLSRARLQFNDGSLGKVSKFTQLNEKPLKGDYSAFNGNYWIME